MAKKDAGSIAAKARSRASRTSKQSILNDFGRVYSTLISDYKTMPPRAKLIDAFLIFLVALGVMQFTFCIIFGTFVSDWFLDMHGPISSWKIVFQLKEYT
jgi:oligosaccharyltransferase complex subunit epsilon